MKQRVKDLFEKLKNLDLEADEKNASIFIELAFRKEQQVMKSNALDRVIPEFGKKILVSRVYELISDTEIK